MVVSLKRGELFLGWVGKCMGKRVWCVVWACIEFWVCFSFGELEFVRLLEVRSV
jgi:hypothetical protein